MSSRLRAPSRDHRSRCRSHGPCTLCGATPATDTALDESACMRPHQQTLLDDGTTPRALVEVVRSSRRRQSSSAAVRDGRIVVRIPAHLSGRQEDRTVRQLLDRLHERACEPGPACRLPRHAPPRPTRGPRGPRGDLFLVERADAVAARWLGDLDLPPAHVTWSHRMHTRWASCSMPGARIRVSHRLGDAPDEVLDAILLHELAHVVEQGHGPAFHALADRDPARSEVDAWLARRSHEALRTALGLD